MQRLKDKVAVIYGAGGVGSTVALEFAKQGARVFLAGRTALKLETVAKEVKWNGGIIETKIVDALDQEQVEQHLAEVADKAGKIDISFNAVGLPQTNHQGTALTELTLENYLLPITYYSQSHFITAKAALKRMIQQKQGVILMNTPSPSRISVSYMGGMPATWSAIEALSRSISAEYGPQGIRSVCILTSAMHDTPLINEVYDLHAKAHNIDYKQFHAGMESRTHVGRLTSVHDLAAAAVFAASDEGKSLTGTILNLTAGLVVN